MASQIGMLGRGLNYGRQMCAAANLLRAVDTPYAFFFFLMFLYALVYASRLLTLGLPLSIPTPLCLQLFSAVFLYATKILQDNDLTQSLCCCFNCSPEWRIR